MAPSPDDQAFRLITSRLVAPEEWAKPIVDQETIYPTIEALKTAYSAAHRPLPAFVHGTRALAPIHGAENILDALFPHGVPEIDILPRETAKNLALLIRIAERVAASPGMEEVLEDPSIVVVLDEERFLERIEAGLGLPRDGDEAHAPANENLEG
ncbi:hypothetical protein [Microvirga tunisiensis]|uniref:Uncharacterized protein n=1 Tax=Microvirga tunisiensis TaxID=2108360 RepID=A0A5N7MC40_9HYPH|nr:hypothetical protein [Microvirga tunisiensis]MPR05619.1 hypothetical protein [Microvirga tunisiensis]MPR23819.1 hypothetical protein [Microvirga tunisiensis]